MTHYGGFAALVHKLYTERNYWSASFHPRNCREKCMKLAKCDAVIGLLELWNWKKPTALFVLWCAGSKLHWLMELHALTACDTTRNYYSRGAKKSVCLLRRHLHTVQSLSSVQSCSYINTGDIVHSPVFIKQPVLHLIMFPCTPSGGWLWLFTTVSHKHTAWWANMCPT